MTSRWLVPLMLVSLGASATEATRTADPASTALELPGLLQLALEHDGRILAAHAKLGAYRAQYDRARWAWFPTVKLKALFGGPTGARRLACPDDPTCVELANKDNTGLGNFSEQISFAVGGKLEANLPIYTFGKIASAKQAARAGVDVGHADIDRIRQEVALEVRRAWYGWQLACTAVDVLEDGEKKLKDAEKKLIKMLDELNEDVAERDLFKLRYRGAEVRVMLVRARKGKQQALTAMRFLTGLADLGGERALNESGLDKPTLTIQARADCVEQALRQRPEAKMLAGALRAALAAVEMRKAAFYPDLFLGGYVEGSYSPAHDRIENSLLNRGLTYYSAGASIGLQVSLNIPQKFFLLEQAQAEVRRVQAQVGQARKSLAWQIDQRLAELEAVQAEAKLLRRGHRAAKAWMRSNVMSYGVGLSDTKDLLDSLAANARSKMEQDRAIHDMYLARDRMRLTIGADLGQAN
jgi:outer membrane protein TolC